MQMTRSILQSHGALADVLVGVAIVGIVIATAVHDFQRVISHVEMIEAAFLLPGSRVDLHEYRAVHGVWPDRGAVDTHFRPLEGDPGRQVSSIRADAAGVLHFTIVPSNDDRGRTLSYRSALMPGIPSSPIVWLCGLAPVPPGFIATGIDATDFAIAQLPSPCRPRGPPAIEASTGVLTDG